MSTEIGITKNNSFTSFWGGNEHGKMVQITGKNGYVEFTMIEAVDAINILVDFIKDEAVRRQQLLKEEVKKHKEMEKTVFSEVAELARDLVGLTAKSIALKYVDTFCPTASSPEIKDKAKTSEI